MLANKGGLCLMQGLVGNWLAQGGMEWGPISVMCNLENLTQCKALLEIVNF
jgi:hypothetical protein